MKLLFIENRYKTFLMASVANQLSKSGHEVHWLVQNKEFLPSGNFETHIIDYPSGNKPINVKDEAVEDVIKSDRQFNHFNKKNTAYFYYYNAKIEQYLNALKPDLVFGESTAFHELLTINNCIKQDILYLNPCTCRYPIGRFSFYKYNTLEPYFGSNEFLSNEEAENVIDQIINRKTAPDYMKPRRISKGEIIKDKIKKIQSYIKGEKYNTPSPLIKFKLEKEKDKNIKLWDAFAQNTINTPNKTVVLYPLQMQPEANIDVWGRKHRNQLQLIKAISKSLSDDTVLVVKPNPKSKYELSRALVNYVKDSANIIGLQHHVKMDDVLPFIDLVITVTGTVAIECVLSNKPIVTLTKTVNNTANNCIFINNVDTELEPLINSVKNKSFNKISNQEKIDFINVLNSTSYQGIISDPFSDENCMSSSNIEIVSSAFKKVIEKNNV
ncbi:hypothetical protein ACFPH8_02530 [Bizionia hallyeonensis]|uniref:Capsule polysaccharide biosynthesis protein n=1 Tax=Bizionia hallyeonensis TaxID=1123757 RepID=A0ABW0C2G3_9FLAO